MQSSTSEGLLERLALPRDLLEAHRLISGGILTQVICKIAINFDIEAATICRWVGINRATVDRHDKYAGKRLSSGQSAAVYGMARALDAVVEMFDGDKKKALIWLETPARALGCQAPVDFLSTPAGVDAVFDLIVRIEHGAVS